MGGGHYSSTPGRKILIRMDNASALTILAAILPTAGTVVLGILSGLLNRSVRAIDQKLERMDGKLDGHGDRLTRLEARLDAQAAALASLEQRVSTLEPRRRAR